MLVTSNFSFSHSVFYRFGELSAISANLIWPRANSFSVDKPKICLVGKELINMTPLPYVKIQDLSRLKTWNKYDLQTEIALGRAGKWGKGENAFHWHFLLFPQYFKSFPNKPLFLRVCGTSLLKRLWEKEKFVKKCFSFSHSLFYPFGELFAIFIKFEIVVCKLFQARRV